MAIGSGAVLIAILYPTRHSYRRLYGKRLLIRGAGLIVALPLLVLVSSYASRRFRWGRA